MHELGILYHVVEHVQKVVEANALCEVEAIVLQVGELSSVVPRYLHACFPAAVDGTMFAATKLEILVTPANASCNSCGEVFNALAHRSACPHCGGQARTLISGREFLIKEIRAR